MSNQMNLLSLSFKGQEDLAKHGIVIYLKKLVHGVHILRFLCRWWSRAGGFCFPYTERSLLRMKCHPTMLVKLAQKAATLFDKRPHQPRSFSVEHCNLSAALRI